MISPGRPMIAMTAAALCLGAAANAADLFVGGTIGEVYKGDSYTGNFQHFGGICLAPVQALGIDDANVYAGDENGGILRLDLATGKLMDLFWVPGDATDIVAHGQHILVSNTNGNIHRVDPITTQVLDTLISPIQVQAMAIDGDDLYVAGTIGEVYKGSALKGNFHQFGSSCLAPVQALALDDTSIYAGDGTGAVIRFDLATGDSLGIFFADDGVTALAADGGDVLVSAFNGAIRRFNPETGQLIDTLTAPITVSAMKRLAIAGDIDDDGVVGVLDLLALLGAWGVCPDPPLACPADLDGDGGVGVTDLLILLANWSPA